MAARKNITASLADKLNVTKGSGTSDHSLLYNLDYENSGHTGFASSADIDNINSSITQISTDLTANNDSINQLNTTVNQLNNKINEVDNKTATIDNSVTQLNSRVKTVEDSVSNVDTKIDTAVEGAVKSSNQYTDNKLNKFISDYITEDSGAIDKLEELVKWVDSDAAGVSQISKDIQKAQATADNAQQTATSAQTSANGVVSIANNAQQTATQAQILANNSKTIAENANTTANTVSNNFNEYKTAHNSDYTNSQIDSLFTTAKTYAEGLVDDEAERADNTYATKESVTTAEQNAKKYAREYADEIKATILGDNDKLVATYDTLSEIGQWIDKNGADVTSLLEADKVLTQGVADAKAAAKNAQNDIDEWKTNHSTDYSNKQIDDKVSAVQTALTTYENAHKNDYTNNQIDAKVEAVQTALTNYEQAHNSDYTNIQIDNQISTVSTNATNALSKANTNANEISSLKTKVQTNTNNITTLNTKVGTINTTLQTLSSQVATKANDVLFEKSSIATVNIGNVKADETDLQGLTIKQIIMLILGVEETIDNVIQHIINNNVVSYSGTTSSGIKADTFKLIDGKSAVNTDVGFYTINDTSGNVTQAGYQISTLAGDDGDPQIILIPAFATVINIYQWDALQNSWGLLGNLGEGYWINKGEQTIDGVDYVRYEWDEESQGGGLYDVAQWRFEIQV